MPADPTYQPPRITPAKVLVSILILIACALTLGLFVTPSTSPWFWPMAGAVAVVGAAAMVIPINREP